MSSSIQVGDLTIGDPSRLVFIGGPCVFEEFRPALNTALRLADICAKLDLGFIFKASFDKANRTSVHSYRGPGLEQGLEFLASIREQTGAPVTTDIHTPEQAHRVAECVDLLQIPAFLCRQTDLLLAAAATGRPVNVKKGQFLAPSKAVHIVEKLHSGGASAVMLTERGTTFGHGDLVVDMRSIATMSSFGVPVCFDATHSVQQPGAPGKTSGGQREFVGPLARAAVAAGAHALFAEVHPDPSNARSDAATQLHIEQVASLLGPLAAIYRLRRDYSGDANP